MAYDMHKQDAEKEKRDASDPTYTPIKIVGAILLLATLIAFSVMQFKRW